MQCFKIGCLFIRQRLLIKINILAQFVCCLMYTILLLNTERHFKNYKFCNFLQNTLRSQIVHNALDAADHLILGVLKVWGAGNVRITAATLTDSEGKTHQLTPDHNLETQVSRSLKYSLFTFIPLRSHLFSSWWNFIIFFLKFIFLLFLFLLFSAGADNRCYTKLLSSASSFYYKLEDQHLKAILVFFS